MKAARLEKTDGNKNVVVREIDKPQVSEDKILVEVFAAGVNPYDTYISKGRVPVPVPFTLGGDFAGIVQEVGEKVDGLRKGDGVYGNAAVLSEGSGSFAQFAVVNPKNLAAKPVNVDFIRAGAVPLAGVAAIQGLSEMMNLSASQKILIHGGAGGIGTAAIQLAKYLGAYVATTVGPQGVEYVKKLGADEVIDYQQQKFEDAVKEFDAVFDLIGGETYKRSFQVLKRSGIIVSTKEEPDRELIEKYGVNAAFEPVVINYPRLKKLADLIDQGIIEVKIDRVFTLEQAAAALEYLEEGHPQGKVVLKIK